MATDATLTEEEKRAIYEAIRRNSHSDDRDPCEVITEDYGGDAEQYLRSMARWYGIPIGSKRQQ